MAVGRPGRAVFGNSTYRQVIRSVDWNRALLEAQGRHLLHFTPEQDEAILADDSHPLCGECLKQVLLADDGW